MNDILFEKIKDFVKSSTIYGIGDSLGKLTNFLLLPIISRIFTPSDYGIIDLFIVSYSFILMTLNMNTLTGIQKYYYKENAEYRKKFVSSTIIFIIIIITTIAFVIITFSKNISSLLTGSSIYHSGIILLAICMPFEYLYESLTILLRLKNRATLFSFINILQISLTIVLTFLFVVILKVGITGIFIAKISTIIVLDILLFIIQRKEFSIKISYSLAKEVIIFSLPGQPALIIHSGMEILPRYILAIFSDLTQVGLYGIAMRIASLFSVLIISFNRAWNPLAFSHFGKEDEKKLYEIIFKMLYGTVCFIIVFIALFSTEILKIMTPNKYHSASILVGGICIYIAMKGLILIFSTGLYSSNKVKYISYLAICQFVVFLICSIILVPLYKSIGLIIALDFSSIIYFLLYYETIKKYFLFYIDIKNITHMACYVVLVIFVSISFKMTLIDALIIKSMIVIASFIYYFNFTFNHYEKNKIKKILYNIIRSKIIKPKQI